MRFKKFFLSLLLVYGCSVKQNQEIVSIENLAATNRPIYFISVPLTKFSSIQSPCVEIEIEDKKLSMEIDLGFQGDLTVTKESLDLILLKSFIGEKLMYGVRGKQYPTNLYRIPKVKIGKMTFLEPILQEETQEFTKDSTFIQNKKEPSPRESGRLGWGIFYGVNLLIDVKNSQIVFCNNLATLKKQGYHIETFTKTPLLLERGLVEIETQTSEGPLRCMLDTGATWNILNTDIEEGKSIEQMMWETERVLSLFKINEKDFGPIVFHNMPINIPIYIDAVLGMEFFQNNLVFLDFRERCAYFSKDHWMTTNDQKTER